MHRRMALAGLLAVTSCVGEGEPGIETETSALVLSAHRLLHDDPSGGCDTRDYVGDGDWYPGFCKTECAAAATGMSSSFPAQNGVCGTIVTEAPPLDPGPGPGPDPGSQFTFHFEEFTHLLGCGNGTPAVLLGTGYNLNFATANDRRSPTVTVAGWASDPSLVVGECDNTSAIVGVASDDHWQAQVCIHPGGQWAKRGYGIGGARCSTLANPPGAVLVGATNCKVLDFTSTSVNEAGGGTSFVGTDWDFGFYKGECGDGRYIKGIAHPIVGGGSARATKILCCSALYNNIPS